MCDLRIPPLGKYVKNGNCNFAHIDLFAFVARDLGEDSNAPVFILEAFTRRVSCHAEKPMVLPHAFRTALLRA